MNEDGRRIGVLGGTFDPVHCGHLLIAGEARDALGLDEVVMVPAGQPLLKPSRPVTAAAHRLRMLQLAVAGRPGFRVSEVEIARPGPSYTVDTLAALREQPGGDAGLYFILGWDNLARLPEWREPARLVTLCRLVAVPRPDTPRPDLDALEAAIPGIGQRVIILERPRVHISATAVREMAARGMPLERLVPAPVAAYIGEHRLYTTG